MRPGVLLITALSLWLIVTSCCASPGYTPPVPIPQGDPEMDSMLALLDCYPKEFRISQHIIVKAGGKEYDFIGYLAKNGNGDFRALAFGEMGGKLFDFLEKNGQREVLVRPEGMPINLLSDGVMGDLSHVYKSVLHGAYPARKEDNTISLVVRQKDGGFIEHSFSGGKERGMVSLEAVGGRIVRRAEYTDYRLFPGWDKPIPSRVILSNYRWHYDLRIESLTIDAGPMNEQMLFSK